MYTRTLCAPVQMCDCVCPTVHVHEYMPVCARVTACVCVICVYVCEVYLCAYLCVCMCVVFMRACDCMCACVYLCGYAYAIAFVSVCLRSLR